MKYSWIAYTWRDYFVFKIIDVDSGVPRSYPLGSLGGWPRAPTKLLGAPGPDDQPYMWSPAGFLPQGPLRPSYATGCRFPVFDFVYLCSTLVLVPTRTLGYILAHVQMLCYLLTYLLTYIINIDKWNSFNFFFRKQGWTVGSVSNWKEKNCFSQMQRHAFFSWQLHGVAYCCQFIASVDVTKEKRE